MTSFYSSSLDKYTAFQAHHTDVRQLQPMAGGVVSMTGEELRLTSRTGLPMLTMKNKKSLSKMNCMLCLDENSLLIGCQTGKIVTADLSQGQVVREVSGGGGGGEEVVRVKGTGERREQVREEWRWSRGGKWPI